MESQRKKLQDQAERITEQQRIFEEQQRRLESLRLQIEELAQPPIIPIPPEPPTPDEKPPVAPPAPTPAPQPMRKPKPAPPTTAKEAAPPQEDEDAAPSKPVGQAPETAKTQPLQVADIIDQRGVLTPRGTIVVEPTFQYSNSSVYRVALDGFTVIPALSIGAIDIRSVSRNTVTAAVGLRYGITNRFEIETRLPYISRSDSTTTRPLATPADRETTTKVEGDGIGDIELGLHYQINRGGPGRPFYVGNLRIKSHTGSDPFDVDTDPATGLQTSLPTGTGFWGVQPSMTISLPSDPAVFFGNVSYLWNIKRDIDSETGEIDPGNAFGLSMGMGLALNQRASLSLGYSHSSVQPTKQNGKRVQGSNTLQIGSLLIGMSHRIGKRSNLNVSVAAGVTEDAPDIQFSIRLPSSFSLLD